MVLQWLLDNQPEDFHRTSDVVWITIDCWLKCIPNGLNKTDLPGLCQQLPALMATSQQYVHYIAAHHADDPAEKHLANERQELLITVLGTRDTIRHSIYSYKEQLVQSSIWSELFAGPALLNAAVTGLAGLALYKHKQHTSRQEGTNMGSSSSSSGGRGSNSISRASSRGGRGSSSSSRGKTVGDGIPTIVGASSLAQLLISPDHELVNVPGGQHISYYSTLLVIISTLLLVIISYY